MSNIRAGMTSLKDPDDDYAYQILKGDVERMKLALEKLGILVSAPRNTDSLVRVTVHVCVDGVEMQMVVMGTNPTPI